VQPQRLGWEVSDRERSALAASAYGEVYDSRGNAEPVRNAGAIEVADLILGEHIGGDERLIDTAIVWQARGG
jgi:glutaminase